MKNGPAKAGPYEDGRGPAEAGLYEESIDDESRNNASKDLRRGRLQPAQDAAEILDGEWAADGKYLVVDRRYGPGHRHGRVAIADCMPPADGVWPQVKILMNGAPAPSSGRLLFL